MRNSNPEGLMRLVRRNVSRTKFGGLAIIVLAVLFNPAMAPGYAAGRPKAVQAPKGIPATNSPSQQAPAAAQSSAPVFTFAYVGAYQYAFASGVSAQIMQAKPIASPNEHSLAEISAASTDQKQIAEVGWIVSPSYGDDLPHLFVYHWIDGVGTCYSCGFVQVSSSIFPGDPVAVGVVGQYKINYVQGQWQVFYNNTEVGYFPSSEWNGRFTQVGLTQTFGEVALLSSSTCASQMGNASFGSQPGSAVVSGLSLIGSSYQPHFDGYYATYPYLYNYGFTNPRGFNFGGPGTCSSAPHVTITDPKDGYFVSGYEPVTLFVSAEANPVSRATLFVDGVAKASSNTAPYTITWDTLQESGGSHTVQVCAYDVKNVAGCSSIITVEVANP